MLTLLKVFFDICLLRAKPQDVPASPVLLYLALGAHVSVNLLALLNQTSPWKALQAALVDVLVLVAIVYTALLLREHAARSQQTLTALAGCGALISVVAWPVFQLVRDPNIWLLMVLLIVVWQLAVFGHILRHALSMPFIAGIATSIFYIVISSLIIFSFLDLNLAQDIQQ